MSDDSTKAVSGKRSLIASIVMKAVVDSRARYTAGRIAAVSSSASLAFRNSPNAYPASAMAAATKIRIPAHSCHFSTRWHPQQKGMPSAIAAGR
ncbi:MAG: hypothetical protein AMJ54_17175 [Deltaproteobacteria bacterium SG8_13]|nr:MAG: hypothetical protein AMJ54_17175 [Deltaproteobacteria bacterium SG8_13]